MVELSAVNRSVVGSNPTCGAIFLFNYIYVGPLVKWLRHRPFTAVTRVRIPYGSLSILLWSRGVAVNMPACHAGDRGFDSRRDRHYFFDYTYQGSVAQSVEHVIEAHSVGGSIPS